MTLRKGELFSRNYLKKERLEKDTKRFRTKISGYYEKFYKENLHFNNNCGKEIEMELGADVDRANYALVGEKYNVDAFLKNAELRDVLDTITLIYRLKKDSNWKNFIEKVFKEEGLCYTLDEDCGIHPYVDDQLQQNNVATLRCLEKDNLNSSKQDTIVAIKPTKEAV